jgi:hypothetical protein
MYFAVEKKKKEKKKKKRKYFNDIHDKSKLDLHSV